MEGTAKIRRSVTRGALTALLAASGFVRAADLGAVAPNCALRSLADGERHELRDFHGQVLWVDFWASWCGPCLESFAFLDRLDRELQPRGFRVIGVNVDEQQGDALAFLAKHPVGFPQSDDDTGQCPRAFGVEGMPAAYLVDRRGVVRYVHLGFRRGEGASLRERVEGLLAEPAE